jgi:hypothetical protein
VKVTSGEPQKSILRPTARNAFLFASLVVFAGSCLYSRSADQFSLLVGLGLSAVACIGCVVSQAIDEPASSLLSVGSVASLQLYSLFPRDVVELAVVGAGTVLLVAHLESRREEPDPAKKAIVNGKRDSLDVLRLLIALLIPTGSILASLLIRRPDSEAPLLLLSLAPDWFSASGWLSPGSLLLSMVMLGITFSIVCWAISQVMSLDIPNEFSRAALIVLEERRTGSKKKRLSDISLLLASALLLIPLVLVPLLFPKLILAFENVVSIIFAAADKLIGAMLGG